MKQFGGLRLLQTSGFDDLLKLNHQFRPDEQVGRLGCRESKVFENVPARASDLYGHLVSLSGFDVAVVSDSVSSWPVQCRPAMFCGFAFRTRAAHRRLPRTLRYRTPGGPAWSECEPRGPQGRRLSSASSRSADVLLVSGAADNPPIAERRTESGEYPGATIRPRTGVSSTRLKYTSIYMSSQVTKSPNNPLHLTAGVVCGAESRGHSPAAGERER